MIYMSLSYRSLTGLAVPAVLLTLLFGTMYGCGHYILRQSADDPQIQLSEDAAQKLEISAEAAQPLTNGSIDVATSLAPYVVLYSTDGQPISGNGYLDSMLPALPLGVLTTADEKGQNRITWQPRPGLRQALVITKAGAKGFAVSGRSLRETENRISQLSGFIIFGWIVSLLLLAGGLWSKKTELRR